MHKIVFDVEIANELNGSYMNFDYEYEVDDDMTENEVHSLADDIASGFHQNFYDEILSWISINPSVSYIEMEDND
jgi:hypothetical protein